MSRRPVEERLFIIERANPRKHTAGNVGGLCRECRENGQLFSASYQNHHEGRNGPMAGCYAPAVCGCCFRGEREQAIRMVVPAKEVPHELV